MTAQANYSLYAIPAFWALAFVPHLYAVSLARSRTNGYFDNTNPRSKGFADALQKRMGPTAYGQFERAKAAHSNSLENLAPLVGAVVLGNVASLPVSTLNRAALTFLILRAVYIPIYIGVTSPKLSYVRTLVFFLSELPCFYLMISAGNAVYSRST